MRKAWILVLFAVLLVGCAALKQGTNDANACWQDADCRAQAVAKAENVKSQATAIGNLAPVPWAGAAVGAIGYGIGLVTFLVLGGRKKREDKPVV